MMLQTGVRPPVNMTRLVREVMAPGRAHPRKLDSSWHRDGFQKSFVDHVSGWIQRRGPP